MCDGDGAVAAADGAVVKQEVDAGVGTSSHGDVVKQPVCCEPSRAPAPSTAGDACEAPASSSAGGGPEVPPLPGEGRRVTTGDIQLVQNLIERCLQLYMSQREVVAALHSQAKVEPGFTALVWHKLEEQNPEFFRSYYTRLKLKDQIIMFNHLLEQQVQMVQKMQHAWITPGGFGMMRPGGGPLPPPGGPYPAGFAGPGMPMPMAGGALGYPVASGGPPSTDAQSCLEEGVDAMGPMMPPGPFMGMPMPVPMYMGDQAATYPGGVPGMPGADGGGGGDGLTGGGPLPAMSPDLSFPLLSAGGVPGLSFPAVPGADGGPPDLSLPRNFSLSDLNFELQQPDLDLGGVVGGGGHGEPGVLSHSFSLSQLAPLDVDGLDEKPPGDHNSWLPCNEARSNLPPAPLPAPVGTAFIGSKTLGLRASNPFFR